MMGLTRSRNRTPEQAAPAEPDDVPELDDATGPGEAPEPDDELDDDSPRGPIGEDTPPEEITAEAERQRRAAQVASGHAASESAEAEQVMAEARERAAQVIAEAERAARVLSESAGEAQRQATDLEQHAKYLDAAAAGTTAMAEANARAAALQAERERLTETAAELDGKIAALDAERGQLATQMDDARESGDLDALAAHRTRDSAAAEVIASLNAQQGAALARVAEIGDGTENFSNHPLLKVMPPLALALQAAEHARRSARQALNMAYPERPEAAMDRLKAELAERERYRRDSWDAELARQQAARPRTFVGL